MPDEGNCCICLEPLIGGEHDSPPAPLAATSPCGHVFHQACLGSLMDFAKSQARPCKCPMCNRPNVTSVKLFLDMPKVVQLAAPATPDPTLDDEPHDCATNNEPVPHERYQACQQQARQYRKRWQTAKENITKQAQRLQQHQTQVDGLQSQLEQAAREFQAQAQVVCQQDRQIECLRLEKIQSQRECEQLQRQLDLAEERVNQANAQLAETKKSFDTALQQASAQSLHEVQHIAQENKRLKALLKDAPPTKMTTTKRTGNKLKQHPHPALAHAARRKALLADLGDARQASSSVTAAWPGYPTSATGSRSGTGKYLPKRKRAPATSLPAESSLSDAVADRSRQTVPPRNKRNTTDILDALDHPNHTSRPALQLLSSPSTAKRMRYHSSSSRSLPGVGRSLLSRTR